jgi:hypothetical protein
LTTRKSDFRSTPINGHRRTRPVGPFGARSEHPARFPIATSPLALQINMVRARVSQGIDPIYAGELVREGVEKDWPYIFTDLEFEPMIEARFAAIKQGFDHIRGRNPKR